MILNIWREYSIYKENYILNSHRIYEELKRNNNTEQLKQFEKMEKVFEKYFIDNGCPPIKNEGMEIFKSGFTHFKPDLGMRFAKLTFIYFHSIFALISILIFFANIKMIKK